MVKKKGNGQKTLETIEFFVRITRAILGSLFAMVLGIIFILILFSLFVPSFKMDSGNVALIPLKGVISTGPTGSFTAEAAQSQKIVDWIKDADEEDNIKAIVIEIDSPGGSPVASYEIADAIKKSSKPTIALIRERGASGGFWAATAADTIFANPMSITGSIGVIGSYVEYAGLIERYNMTYRRFVAGENKDAVSPLKEITPEQAKIFQKKIDKLHDYFINAVAENRKLSKEQVLKDADGFIMLGSEALEKGYIDYLGGRDEVKEYINATLGIKNPDFKEYKAAPSFFNMLGMSMNHFGYSIGKGVGSNLEEDFNLKV